MAKLFRGVVNLDIRESVPDWSPHDQPKAPPGAPNALHIVLDDVGPPWAFTGGTVHRIAVDVSGEPYIDLEREAATMLARE
jgi:hypothetical protein